MDPIRFSWWRVLWIGIIFCTTSVAVVVAAAAAACVILVLLVLVLVLVVVVVVPVVVVVVDKVLHVEKEIRMGRKGNCDGIGKHGW